MSLDHLKVSQNILHPILGIAFVEFVLLIVMLIMTTTVFAIPSGIELKFPYEAGQMVTEGASAIVQVTGENVIYFNKRVVTLNELRRLLSQGDYRNSLIFIKADRRAAMGRISDIFDLCRGIPGARVNVSTNY